MEDGTFKSGQRRIIAKDGRKFLKVRAFDENWELNDMDWPYSPVDLTFIEHLKKYENSKNEADKAEHMIAALSEIFDKKIVKLILRNCDEGFDFAIDCLEDIRRGFEEFQIEAAERAKIKRETENEKILKHTINNAAQYINPDYNKLLIESINNNE